MRFSNCVHALLIAPTLISAAQHFDRSLQHTGNKHPQYKSQKRAAPPIIQRSDSSRYLTNLTAKYSVNGTEIPDVHFNVGESYAGLMPLSKDKDETNEFYFWFFPSENPEADDEILIWMNGGPGCSSLEGLMQENGPFFWQFGTYLPVSNPYTWNNLTNVVWVEHPIGTGFSQGTPTATGAIDIATQFLGFWENFVDTFALHGRKVFITGESYAGTVIPYIADAMLNSNDTAYHNVEATMLIAPYFNSDALQVQIPVAQFVDYWGGLFPLKDSDREFLYTKAESCGYNDFVSKYLTFPPPGPFPSYLTLPGTDKDGNSIEECDLWYWTLIVVSKINPCFNMYQITTTCPMLWDVLGYPGSLFYQPEGASIYFNRTDVQKAINAPFQEWASCSDGVLVDGIDTSLPAAISVLPGVIERSKRTMIALDFRLFSNGTLLAIQNMTWNGAQGFQQKPTAPFYVPFDENVNLESIAGAGVFGTTHTERGLTWVSVALAGHMVPQYAPSAAYRNLEFLLGRIDSLSSTAPFTTANVPQPNDPLGNGTGPPVKREL